MAKQIASLIIDAGNSETRVATLLPNGKNGVRRKVKTLSNHYAIFDTLINNNSGDPVNSENSAIFTATGQVNGETVEAKYVNGLLADREYSARLVTPSGLSQKYESLTTLLAIHNAFKAGYESIAEMTNVSIKNLDIKWRVHILMPPEDVETGARQMADVIRSVKEINFELPQIEKTIEIEDGGITVESEGLSAFMGVLLDGRGVRPGYEYLAQETTLVMDIGAGTTDYMVLENGFPIESTKFTVNRGGNNVSATLTQLLKRAGFGSVTQKRAREAVVTGLLQDGSRKEDVTEYIARAKEQVGVSLITSLVEFFESNGYDTRSIGRLLAVGGGAKSSSNEKINPIADVLIARMKEYSPRIELVDLPRETVHTEDETFEREVDTRMLNVLGSSYKAAVHLV